MNPAPSISTLRPRNRRFTHEDDEDGSSSRPTSDQPGLTISSSAASSRAVSPSLRARPFQTARENIESQRSRSTGRFLSVPGISGSQGSTLATGLWDSWSSLRGIASDLIGGQSSRGPSPGASPALPRKPLESTAGRTKIPTTQWGPALPADRELGVGTKERQRAEIEARKRERLLIANGHVTPDGSGRYKRRGSFEPEHSSQTPGENDDRDTLIYIHQVQPGDTLAGVMIKYNCQAQIFKRANRLWPGDSIQSRKTVVLPIDACGVRGRKISEAELAEHQHVEVISTSGVSRASLPRTNEENKMPCPSTPYSSTPTSPSISVSLSNSDDPPYRHDSWVMIEGFKEPVEIARLPKRALGYFPRSRRKSRSISDLDTPAASLELPRGSFQTDVRSPGSTARSNSNSYFASLHGPGGVGSMGRNVRSPGPANDGLNKLFPSMEQRVAPKGSLEFESQASFTSQSQSTGLDTIGGSIEGWVRKIATKASSSLQPPTPQGRARAGDLIELTEDAFDLGHSTRHEDPLHRGPPPSSKDVQGDSGLATDGDLQDSFAPRGRVFHDSAKRQN